nr:MAG: hypothetical protein DIU80_05040 [Chloroflexota bacterium]
MAASRLRQLRARVPDFVGREAEIDEIVQTLRPATAGAAFAISGVRGMGGIGKSELAFAAAQRLRDDFPDAQIVLSLCGSFDPMPRCALYRRSFAPSSRRRSSPTMRGSSWRSTARR